MAHREAVLQKKKKAEEQRLKVQIPEIERDRSKDKKVSHMRLLDLVNKLGSEGITRLYRKKELQHLCAAYNIRLVSRWNKMKLALELAQAIPRFEAVPRYESLRPIPLMLLRSVVTGFLCYEFADSKDKYM